jgi:hypothetical protein
MRASPLYKARIPKTTWAGTSPQMVLLSESLFVIPSLSFDFSNGCCKGGVLTV